MWNTAHGNPLIIFIVLSGRYTAAELGAAKGGLGQLGLPFCLARWKAYSKTREHQTCFAQLRFGLASWLGVSSFSVTHAQTSEEAVLASG